ncbi:Sec-independent protein translocase protein TatB [Marinicella sp. S1101]|uniref:Sec-independent protein translocase protein TatB n=1 Tax=Marinicella marina TaxID=2996016 RepID=UPI002260A3A3|nr:Sec-independent protein translocase protein TatB [Marinicella marina]MCX7552676.1 Sec-independent protein translocase protein TatB [Marinicella marina]MDJ1139552.1 Sec-independent protein translocase protein TatB [Marinicella marina]
MFDIGFTELLVVFVVALLVVGPERLPMVARKFGMYVGKMRRSFQSIKDEVEQELEIEAVKAQLKENAMIAEAKELEAEMKKTIGPSDKSAAKTPQNNESNTQ